MAGFSDTSFLVHLRAGRGDAALVFIHGFRGDLRTTWGQFPELIRDHRSLRGWDIFSLGYDTNLRADLPGLWSASAPLDRISQLLSTAASTNLSRYRNLSFAAHSMGGLVLQKALLEDAKLLRRTGHIALFGTPCNGLKKAGWLRFWKRQLRDMGERSDFIRTLRQGWNDRFGKRRPFALVAVAGERDEFVPSQSSLDPFPYEDRRVIPGGNHLSIVKPSQVTDLSVQILVALLAGKAAPAGPWDSARMAVERREFTVAIEELWPHRTELDDDGLVLLALALESDGRSEDALEVLAQGKHKGTDAMGTLAGRLKRRWLVERRKADAEQALSLYGEGLRLSEERNDHAQAYYHAINVAFMQLAFCKDRSAAKRLAERSLEHCGAVAAPDKWSLATEGEAYLLLGNESDALDRYGKAMVADATPREIESMYQQALKVAGLVSSRETAERLERLFRGEA